MTTGERENFMALVENLLDTYTPAGVSIWLNSYNRGLGDKPCNLIREGQWEPLLAEANRLAGGPTQCVVLS